MEYVAVTAASDDGLDIDVTIRKADFARLVEREQAVGKGCGSPRGVFMGFDPAIRAWGGVVSIVHGVSPPVGELVCVRSSGQTGDFSPVCV